MMPYNQWLRSPTNDWEASKAKAKRYKRYTIDEVSSSITPTNDFSLGKWINILETMEEVNDEIFMKAVEKFN